VYSVVAAPVNGLFGRQLPNWAGDFDNNHHSHLGPYEGKHCWRGADRSGNILDPAAKNRFAELELNAQQLP
jgi:hypothetical protein